MPSVEQEIVFYGTRLWPRLPTATQYDYDQIRAAVWTFKDFHSWNMTTNDTAPGSIALRTRFLVKWFSVYLIRINGRENPMARIFNLMKWLSSLYEQAPDAECKWPMHPHAEADSALPEAVQQSIDVACPRINLCIGRTRPRRAIDC
jgi:hypothetical protein